MLILKLLQMRSTFGWSLSNLAAMLRMNLLVYRDLWRWLDEPYTKPPDPPQHQLELFGSHSRTADRPTCTEDRDIIRPERRVRGYNAC